jgi:hypothetical protein
MATVLLLSVLLVPPVSATEVCTLLQSKGCLLEKIGEKGYEGRCPPGGGHCARCLDYYVGARFNDRTSRENCACLCHQHGFTLAGVENGNNCYCASEGAAFPGPFCGGAASSGCDVACDANRSEACGGRDRVEVFSFSCTGSSCMAAPHSPRPAPTPPPPAPAPPQLGCRPALGMRCGLPHWTPAVHVAPPCYHAGGPHDIAGALWDAPTKTWHLMAGCWRSGGWQHLTSSDLVSWTVEGAPRSFGGTGGMVHDDDGHIVAYAMSGGELRFWVASNASASSWTQTNTTVKACCNDPIVWKSAGRWYAITAQHGSGKGGPNYGDETFFTSKVLVGPDADWQPLPLWFADRGSLLIPGHNMSHEFVSPDYFQNISGDPTNTAAVFLTSTYGAFADPWQSKKGALSELTAAAAAAAALRPLPPQPD